MYLFLGPLQSVKLKHIVFGIVVVGAALGIGYFFEHRADVRHQLEMTREGLWQGVRADLQRRYPGEALAYEGVETNDRFDCVRGYVRRPNGAARIGFAATAFDLAIEGVAAPRQENQFDWAWPHCGKDTPMRSLEG